MKKGHSVSKTKKALSFGLDIETVSSFSRQGIMRGYSTPELHFHPFHQVLFIYSGVTVLEDEKEKIPLYGSMTAFIPAEVGHKSTVIGESVEYHSIYFHKSLFKHRHGGIELFNISELGFALLLELSRRSFGSIAVGYRGRCLRLFLEILKKDLKTRVRHLHLPIPQDAGNQKIIDYIQANYSQVIRLDDLRAVLPYSKRHIARLFSRDLKITLFDYLRLHRIFIASLALSQQKDRIIDVAYDSGYQSLSSFYKDFHRYLGVTPRAFRNRKKRVPLLAFPTRRPSGS